ncbi:MAG: ABC transporter substrate-binding protein [Candidatus Symbiobacter sp.]|nr:ABC transporter substrate-binding protein [Candidatus Symbiobacter sp.]
MSLSKNILRHMTGVAGATALILATSSLTGTLTTTARAADELHIGFVGVTSGPAAAWGTSNKRSMETRADWLNETGGVEIGGKKYKIVIDSFDDQKDPKLAIEGINQMISKGVHYVVGPNTDDGASAVRPDAEAKGVIYFPYAFPKELYTKPAKNAVLGMIANYQSGPAIFKWLKDNEKLQTLAMIAANESDALSQRDGGMAAAKAAGLKVVSGTVTYQSDTTDFAPILTPVIKSKPGAIYLAGVSPAHAPRIIKVGRELGFKGRFIATTGMDAKVLKEGAGDAANGFISVGGASTPELASPMMKEFVTRYTKKFGEYNDESNTKVYALDYILETLKANPKAMKDVNEFKKTIDSFSANNPFVNGGDKPNMKMRYVGMSSFGQKRQIFVPMVINEYRDGDFKTLFVGQAD